MFCNCDFTYDWRAYHKGIGETKYFNLNQTTAAATATNAWNDTAPTSSVFSLGDGSTVNQNTDNFIAYCFAEKQGFSKFGSYTGNGNADGTFVYTGFKPAWIMIKRTDGANSWVIYDNKREGYNVDNDPLQANGITEPVTFNANLFKEMLVANKECKSAVLEVSNEGLAKVNFKIDDYDSTYYIVAMSDVD